MYVALSIKRKLRLERLCIERLFSYAKFNKSTIQSRLDVENFTKNVFLKMTEKFTVDEEPLGRLFQAAGVVINQEYKPRDPNSSGNGCGLLTTTLSKSVSKLAG